MRGAVSEVDELLRMPEGEARAGTGMAGVGHRGGVAALQRAGESALTDRPRPAAVAVGPESAIPLFGGHPHFDVDLRIGSRLKGRPHAARSGKIVERAANWIFFGSDRARPRDGDVLES